MVASWVEQGRETPRISKSDQMRLSRIVIHVQNTRMDDLLLGHGRTVKSALKFEG